MAFSAPGRSQHMQPREIVCSDSLGHREQRDQFLRTMLTCFIPYEGHTYPVRLLRWEWIAKLMGVYRISNDSEDCCLSASTT